MDKTVAFHNLGCKVNLYEMEIMMKDLAENGFRIVAFDQKADVYVINTCSVTNIADRKSRQMIHRARALNPDALVVAAGCYGDTHGREETLAEQADVCILNKEKKDFADIILRELRGRGRELGACEPRELRGRGTRQPEGRPRDDDPVSGEGKQEAQVSDPTVNPECPDESEGFADCRRQEAAASLKENLHTRKFLKVQDGCDRFCTYCIIPYARDRISSRPVKDVCDEAKAYARMGYREIVPTGIHISSYGKDRPEEGEDLLTLLKALSQVEGVERVRLSSLEPMTVTEDFARELSSLPGICPHFHLSLQSGCDEVLKRMNRRYTTDRFMESVEILRRYFRDPAITTDIITGFPGETEQEFMQTVDFVKQVGFYETHIFKYSRRKGTVADRMPGQLPEKVKHQRSSVLMELCREGRRTFEDRHIASGEEAEVLLEDTEKRGKGVFRTGYTREYIKVYADPLSTKEGEILKGHMERNKSGDIIIS